VETTTSPPPCDHPYHGGFGNQRCASCDIAGVAAVHGVRLVVLDDDQYDTLRLLVQTEIGRHLLAGGPPPQRLEELRAAVAAPVTE
jgi:hypothetical protein